MPVELYPSNGYRVKTPFWSPQQLEGFERSCDESSYCLFMSPRTGKSKIIVDTTCRWFQPEPNHPLGIRGVLIVTYPNGGHIGWIRDAFPESVTVPWRGFIWDSNKSGQVSFQKEFDELLKTKGLAIFSVNAESLIAEECKVHIGRFMKTRQRIMAVADESTFMMNATARRTIIMHNISNKKEYIASRRILDGTPVGRKGPLDFYAQVGFLGHHILGYPNPVEFKYHYAEFKLHGRGPFWAKVRQLREKAIAEGRSEQLAQEIALRNAKLGTLVEPDGTKRRARPGRDYWETLEEDEDGKPKFKNVDELWERLDKVSYRATFAECFPDSLRPIFSKRYVVLSKEQRRVYDEIDVEYRSVLDDGTEIDVAHKLTRILRLQQVCSNYFPERRKLDLHEDCLGMGCEACGGSGVVETLEPLKLIDREHNPRLDALREELREGTPTIIWARFHQDIDACMAVAVEMGMSPVQYDGRVSNAAKLEARDLFQAGKAGAFVANQAAAARAIRLDKATKHVAYSNVFSFFTRQQLEERAEHGSKKTATSFVDLVAVDTVDDQSIIPALRQGMDVSNFILRDKPKEWI